MSNRLLFNEGISNHGTVRKFKVSESNQAKYQEVPKLENLIFFFEKPEQKILTLRLSEFKILNMQPP